MVKSQSRHLGTFSIWLVSDQAVTFFDRDNKRANEKQLNTLAEAK